jgi:hypothetical protein
VLRAVIGVFVSVCWQPRSEVPLRELTLLDPDGSLPPRGMRANPVGGPLRETFAVWSETNVRLGIHGPCNRGPWRVLFYLRCPQVIRSRGWTHTSGDVTRFLVGGEGSDRRSGSGATVFTCVSTCVVRKATSLGWTRTIRTCDIHIRTFPVCVRGWVGRCGWLGARLPEPPRDPALRLQADQQPRRASEGEGP